MKWILAYLISGVIVCFLSYRSAKRNQIKTPNGPTLTVPFDLDGAFFLMLAIIIIWPILLPLWVWLEIEAKRTREKEKERKLLENEMKKKNPHHGISTS